MRTTQKMVAQVVVSVAAAVCVAFITNAYLERKPAPEAPAIAGTAAEASTGPSADPAVRVIVGTTNGQGPPSRPLPPVAQSPVQNAADTPLPARTEEAAILPPLASETIADLPVRDVTPQGAEIFPGVPAESTLAEALRDNQPAPDRPERRRFLGLPLPSFMVAPSQLVESASAAGGKLVSVVEGR